MELRQVIIKYLVKNFGLDKSLFNKGRVKIHPSHVFTGKSKTFKRNKRRGL